MTLPACNIPKQDALGIEQLLGRSGTPHTGTEYLRDCTLDNYGYHLTLGQMQPPSRLQQAESRDDQPRDTHSPVATTMRCTILLGWRCTYGPALHQANVAPETSPQQAQCKGPWKFVGTHIGSWLSFVGSHHSYTHMIPQRSHNYTHKTRMPTLAHMPHVASTHPTPGGIFAAFRFVTAGWVEARKCTSKYEDCHRQPNPSFLQAPRGPQGYILYILGGPGKRT